MNPVDNTTHAVAVGAITSPFWLPDLATVSATAAELLPIFGLIWLIVQIFAKIFWKK